MCNFTSEELNYLKTLIINANPNPPPKYKRILDKIENKLMRIHL